MFYNSSESEWITEGSQEIKESQEIFKSKFNGKLFRSQLAYFEDIDYTEAVEFLPGFETERETIQKFLIEISLN